MALRPCHITSSHPLIDITEVTAGIKERCRVVEMGYFITFTFFYLVHYRYLVHPRLAICGVLLRYNLSSYMRFIGKRFIAQIQQDCISNTSMLDMRPELN